MKYRENSGIDSSILASGYSDTGYIPEEFDNVMQAETMAKKEKAEERAEAKMADMYGLPVENDIGGFLERNNTDDRY
jgi:hypothetical protein